MQPKTMLNLAKKEGISFKGTHKITVADISSSEAKTMEQDLIRLEKTDKKEFLNLLKNFNKTFGIREMTVDNVTPDEGRQRIAEALSGQLSAIADIEINYGALGTGSNAESTSDTSLQTESFRKAISSGTYSGESIFITMFYTATDCDGTYEEHGLFIDGTATTDSGEIISRLLLSSLVKGNTETLTVETEIALTDT